MSQDSDAREAHGAAEDRRRHRRAPVAILVDLRFASVQQFLSAHAEDISESGMFLRGWTPPPDAPPLRTGEVVTLRFDAGNERIVDGTARIVRLVEDEVRGSGLGIEFVELAPHSRRLIEMIVRIKLAAG